VEKLLTVPQLSQLIQFSPKTIYQWVHQGVVPCYKFSKGIRFREKEIDGWIRRRHRRGRNTIKIDLEKN